MVIEIKSHCFPKFAFNHFISFLYGCRFESRSWEDGEFNEVTLSYDPRVEYSIILPFFTWPYISLIIVYNWQKIYDQQQSLVTI